jgi:transcriptional regulator with XRE-family HTH domain
MTIYEQLGKRITYLRKQKGMSQLDLSVESEINKNYISDLERGRRNPSLMILSRIAGALKIDMATLLQGIQDYSMEDIISTVVFTK